MTDQPWNKQPGPIAGPSHLIMPKDTITVTIDNMSRNQQITMQCSRVMPRALVIGIFSSLINQLSGEMMQELMRNYPSTSPDGNPPAARGPNGS